MFLFHLVGRLGLGEKHVSCRIATWPRYRAGGELEIYSFKFANINEISAKSEHYSMRSQREVTRTNTCEPLVYILRPRVELRSRSCGLKVFFFVRLRIVFINQSIIFVL